MTVSTCCMRESGASTMRRWPLGSGVMLTKLVTDRPAFWAMKTRVATVARVSGSPTTSTIFRLRFLDPPPVPPEPSPPSLSRRWMMPSASFRS